MNRRMIAVAFAAVLIAGCAASSTWYNPTTWFGSSATPVPTPVGPTILIEPTPMPLPTPEPTTSAQSTPEPTTAAQATPAAHRRRRHHRATPKPTPRAATSVEGPTTEQ
jgi:hypothetical protein